MKSLGVTEKQNGGLPGKAEATDKPKTRYPSLRIEGASRINALGLKGVKTGDKVTLTIEAEVRGLKSGSLYDFDGEEDSSEVYLELKKGEAETSSKGAPNVLDVIGG